LAEEAAEVEGRAGIGHGWWFVHRDSRTRQRFNFCPLGLMRLLIIKELGGIEWGKAGHECPACRSSHVGGLPPWFHGTTGVGGIRERRMVVGRISGLGGRGYGEFRIFYVGVTRGLGGG
jgi:hypothetical protein